jgi:hypothetical protein
MSFSAGAMLARGPNAAFPKTRTRECGDSLSDFGRKRCENKDIQAGIH